MNILAIHTSHDGCMTYVKNNKIVFHTQLDRYNRFKHSTFPVKPVFEIIENLKNEENLTTQEVLTKYPDLAILLEQEEQQEKLNESNSERVLLKG